MALKRVFLGTDQPALESAVDYLVATFANGKWLDLSRHILVTPGGRASRRLREVIYQRVRKDKLRYLPPKIDTIGSIPESLYESRLPFASEWVQQLTWARAVREVDTDTRRNVFPRTPDNPDDYTESEWLALGRLLQGTYRGLAAETLSFANVAEQGVEMEGFPEQDRWNAMGIIQEKYLYLLRQRQLWDRQTARIRAIFDKECKTEQHITLIGTADIRAALRQMLEQVADRVTALVFAPTEWERRFDELGCILPSVWESAKIDFSQTETTFVDSFSEQAAVTVQTLAELGDAYACDQVTVGCPDDRLVPHLQRSLAAHGINGREVKGQRVTESPVYRCLMAVREALFSESFESYATLGRHPDVFTWLYDSVADQWLNEADEYRAEHLPTKVTERWLGNPDRYSNLIAAFHQLNSLLEPLTKPPQPMSQWSAPIAKVLKTIYGRRKWLRGEPDDSLGVGAFNAVSRFLTEQATLPPEVAPILTASEALELLLEEIDDTRVPPPADADAIELLGWLELPLDDAPVLILTGLTEGIVPNSTTADLFLPNSLRKHLKISDNERRYARDAYALSAILASRKKTQIIVGRVDDEGEPLRPSRLLFAVPDEQVSQRWLQFLERDEMAAPIPMDPPPENQSPTAPTFGFSVPAPIDDGPLIKSVSPTQFKEYIACPYRFYLKRVMKLKKVEDEAREMSALHFGNMAHSVLEDFGRGAAKDSEDAKEIHDMLIDLLKRAAQKRFGKKPPPAVRVQLRQLELRLYHFALEQAKQTRAGWRIRYVETDSSKFETVPEIKTPDGSAGLPLHGKIDRIDRHEETGQYRILDYKTSEGGDAPEKTHRRGNQGAKEWMDLQLPLYRRIAFAMNLPGIDGDISRLNEVGYVTLPKDLAKVKFVTADWNDADFADAEKLASEIVEKIRDRVFWPPNQPKYDDFARILMTTVPERPEFAEED